MTWPLVTWVKFLHKVSNSIVSRYWKNGGAARRRFSAIREKPEGRAFLPPPPSSARVKVIRGADFDSDIHFALRRLEMRSWNHRVIKGQWRHMTENYFSNFDPKYHPWVSKNHRNVLYSSQGHAGHWNFALAPSEAKLSAITGFRHFSALDLTSEVTSWPRTLNFISISSSRGELHGSFFREALAQSGRNGKGSYPPVSWKDAKWPVPARVKIPFLTILGQAPS